MLWLLATAAAASGLYAGIRPDAVDVLAEPVYAASGWVAPIADDEGGSVRVFVARAEPDADAWLASRIEALGSRPPDVAFGADVAVGHAHRLVLFREGNVAVVVERPDGGALELAQRLLEAVEDGAPWPEAPKLHVAGTDARVEGEWARVTWHPTPVLDPDTLMPQPVFVAPTGPGSAHFGVAPRGLEVRVWDAYGRSVAVVRE